MDQSTQYTNQSTGDCDPLAKPFCCPVCNWATKYQSNVTRHIERHHYDYYYHHILMKRQKKKETKVSKADFFRQNPTKHIDSNIEEEEEEEGSTVKKVSKNNYKNNKRSKNNFISPPNSDIEFTSEIAAPNSDNVSVERKREGVIIQAGETDVSSENINKTIFDIRLIPKFKLVIMGPSRSGKTSLVVDLLLNLDNFSSDPPKKIILIYTVWQPIYDKMKTEGLVDVFLQDNTDLESQLTNFMTGEEVLFIFDDMINSKNIDYISQLYMIDGRHKNASLVFISQQGFRNDDAFRSISNNTNYIILMKNGRNILEIQNLAKQMTPGPQPLMMQIFKKATADSFSYLFINFTHECKKETKYLSHLFDEDDVVPAYIPT